MTAAAGRYNQAMAEQQPYWLLISILFSSFPLTPALALTLHQAALELYELGEGSSEVAGELVTGRVHNLRKDMLLGTIGGPAFEADLETERGMGMVRFLLTRAGLERSGAAAPERPAERRPRYLN